jgi:copper(I)-binding protein
MAFTRDNFARVYYPSGISQDDWGHDLPLLVQDAGTGFAAAQPRVTRAFVVAPAGSAPIAIYATIVNPGDAPDTVRACDAELTTECGLHEQRTAGAMMTMHPIAGAVVPPHDTLRLLPGGVHAMLGRVARPPQPGDSVGITFYLARAGAVSVRAPVVAYGDLERALAAPRP